MNKLFLISALVFGSAALAEPCKDHRNVVQANFKEQGWKLISYASDDAVLSVSFRKEGKDGSTILNFLYTTNKLLIIEAGMRGFQAMNGTCTLGGKEANILALATKETKA